MRLRYHFNNFSWYFIFLLLAGIIFILHKIKNLIDYLISSHKKGMMNDRNNNLELSEGVVSLTNVHLIVERNELLGTGLCEFWKGVIKNIKI